MRSVNEIMRAVFVSGGRACGRTHAIIQAAKKCKGSIVLVDSEHFASVLRKRYPGVEIRTTENPERLLGRHAPIFLDHYLLEGFWRLRERQHAEEVAALRKRRDELEDWILHHE